MLRVRAVSNEDKRIVLEEREMKVIIAQPIWLSLWALLFYTILIGLISAIVIRVIILRKQRKVSDEKIHFFINTAHDIRTPLTLIKAPLEELREKEQLSKDGIANTNTALRNVNALLRLTTNLINFERADVYSSELYISEYELNTYMEETFNAFRPYATVKHINFTYESNFRYLNVWFDKEKMDSILKNIISNALKYTPESGRVHVFVSENEDKVFPVTKKILQSGGTEEKTAARLFEDLHMLQYYRHKAKEILKDAVLIMPTAGGTFKRDDVRKDPISTNSQMGLYTNHCNLLDLMAVAVPENTQDKNLPFGITIFGLADSTNLVLQTAESFLKTESIDFAVCGLHKKGYALESQLTELGAEYIESTATAKEYKLYKLNTNPIKPGLVRAENGENINIDIFKIPVSKLGSFMSNVSTPLSIGNVELIDGRWVKGFLCEEYAVKDAEDITSKKSF